MMENTQNRRSLITKQLIWLLKAVAMYEVTCTLCMGTVLLKNVFSFSKFNIRFYYINTGPKHLQRELT